MLTQILAGTPKWVFIIFFVLAYYGYVQSRTREAGKVRILMLPIIMTVLSFGGVVSSFGAGVAPLGAWAVGFAAAVGLNQIIRAPAGVRHDPATGRFHLPGSWTPLCLMMAIYFAKYTVGATSALRPDIATGATFAILLSCLFGGLSGTFFARFLRIWSTASRNSPALPPVSEQSPDWRPTA